MLQKKKISGPPKYFTCDWLAAFRSVKQLADLEPAIVATGHGRPMEGESMRKALHNLVMNFAKKALPPRGRYLDAPALTDERGVLFVPPKNSGSNSPYLKTLGISALLLFTLVWLKGKRLNNAS